MPVSGHYDAVVAFPAMRVGVLTQADAIREIVYLPRSVAPRAPRNALAALAAHQLERYLADPDFRFELPLAEAGTAFQRRVWRAIRSIRRGRTLTYGEMARTLSSSPRAVGQACGANPFPLAIPCHRVVAAQGLGGFAHHGEGFHIEVKEWLLRHERSLSGHQPRRS